MPLMHVSREIVVVTFWLSISIILIHPLPPLSVELFQIGKDKTGANTYDTVYIKDNNTVAVSSESGGKGCISIIDIESQKVTTTISLDTCINGMAVRGRTIYYCARDNSLWYLSSWCLSFVSDWAVYFQLPRVVIVQLPSSGEVTNV
jgi:hypothetical protein